MVLFDESHALKNLTSLRAKFSVKLYGSAKMIFWLSATTGDSTITTKDFEQWCVDNLPGVSRGEFGAWAWAGSKEEEEKVAQSAEYQRSTPRHRLEARASGTARPIFH